MVFVSSSGALNITIHQNINFYESELIKTKQLLILEFINFFAICL